VWVIVLMIEGSTHLWNVGLHLFDYTAVYPRRLGNSDSPPWEPEISQVWVKIITKRVVIFLDTGHIGDRKHIQRRTLLIDVTLRCAEKHERIRRRNLLEDCPSHVDYLWHILFERKTAEITDVTFSSSASAATMGCGCNNETTCSNWFRRFLSKGIHVLEICLLLDEAWFHLSDCIKVRTANCAALETHRQWTTLSLFTEAWRSVRVVLKATQWWLVIFWGSN
jgi:hypothetical protein